MHFHMLHLDFMFYNLSGLFASYTSFCPLSRL